MPTHQLGGSTCWMSRAAAVEARSSENRSVSRCFMIVLLSGIVVKINVILVIVNDNVRLSFIFCSETTVFVWILMINFNCFRRQGFSGILR